jgi:hypothetical protein
MGEGDTFGKLGCAAGIENFRNFITTDFDIRLSV